MSETPKQVQDVREKSMEELGFIRQLSSNMDWTASEDESQNEVDNPK